MSIHQYNPNMLPDSDFFSGSVKYLIAGNQCRRLDRRRTPGVIETVDLKNGMFRWRMTDFEHEGKYWEVPIEDVIMFQFANEAKILPESEISKIKELITSYDKLLLISITVKQREETLQEIKVIQNELQKWFKEESIFFKNQEKLDFHSVQGSKRLASDIQAYLQSKELFELEKRTTDILVLNPSSGEWIKGMRIVLAEMGLMSYNDKRSRTKDIFEGLGTRELRRKYLLNRLAFVWTYFALLGISEVALYRGMSSEKDWDETRPQTFLSYSFSKEVAESFSSPINMDKVKQTKFLKETIPVQRLFMTYFETEAMNREYKEAEALVFPRV